MNFIDIKKQKPEYWRHVLIRFNRYNIYYIPSVYPDYVMGGLSEQEDCFYTDDEDLCQIPLKDVIGWMPIEELDKIEVK